VRVADVQDRLLWRWLNRADLQGTIEMEADLANAGDPTSRAAASTVADAARLAFAQSWIGRGLGGALRAAHRLSPAMATRLALQLFFAPVPSKLGTRGRPPAPWRVETLAVHRDRLALLRHAPFTAPHRTQGAATSRSRRVLLVHGWAGDALQMHALGEAAAAAGYEPVLLDFPGHGRSSGWRCTMPQMVRALFAVQAQIGPLAGVIAHSMGSLAAMHALAKGLEAQRLVVLAPSSSPATVLRWFGDAFGLHEQLVARMRGDIARHGGLKFDEFEPEWFGRHLKTPALVVHDRGDRMAAVSNGVTLAASLPQAQLMLTDGLSHRRVLSDAQVIERALQHLRC
jgi:pimeloyl-ACP methyl ester carboxylesterase